MTVNHWHRTRVAPENTAPPVSAQHKDMAYTPALVPSHQTTQHTLGEDYELKERANIMYGHPIVSFAA
jgi:hypothetical protein